ncbi:MAG TPA: hypothetical protein PKD31_22560, partial [Blastocatellia bacterium]|nr:hypothetical protein [Blastocatellia bacterium]
FYVGAIVTLYGTIFASLAANTRIFADIARLMGFFRADDGEARIRYRKGFLLTLSVVPIVLVFSFKDPVEMVRIGGISQAMMLPVIAIGALYLRYRRLPKQIIPPVWQTAGLWIASIVIIWLMGYSVIEAVRKML